MVVHEDLLTALLTHGQFPRSTALCITTSTKSFVQHNGTRTRVITISSTQGKLAPILTNTHQTKENKYDE